MADQKDNRDILIRDAQWRKGASIGYFNSLNSSLSLVTAIASSFTNEEAMLAKVEEYKNLFIKQHDEYYANVIAKIGLNIDTKEVIKKLNAVTSLDELKKVWLNLSADERADKETHEVAKTIKSKFVK